MILRRLQSCAYSLTIRNTGITFHSVTNGRTLATGDSTESGEFASLPPRDFGFWTGLFAVIASMVGVGILTTSGYTVRETGS